MIGAPAHYWHIDCVPVAIFEVVKACYKLDKVLMNEEVPSWYKKETHAESATFVNRSEVTETLKDQLKDDL